MYNIGLQSNVVVGLRLSNHSYGKSNHIGGQQHVEQHTYLQGGAGMIFCLSHAFLDKGKQKIFHVFRIQVGLKQNKIFIWRYMYTVNFFKIVKILNSFKTAGPCLVPMIRFHMVCRSRLWTTSKLSFQVSE